MLEENDSDIQFNTLFSLFFEFLFDLQYSIICSLLQHFNDLFRPWMINMRFNSVRTKQNEKNDGCCK